MRNVIYANVITAQCRWTRGRHSSSFVAGPP